jgi:hypothetical protein
MALLLTPGDRPSSGVSAGGGLSKAARSGASRKGGAKGPSDAWMGPKAKGE